MTTATQVDMSRAAFEAWLRQFGDDDRPCQGQDRCALERYAYGPGNNLPHKVKSGMGLSYERAWAAVFRRTVDVGPNWAEQTAGQWRAILDRIPRSLDDREPTADDGEYQLGYEIASQVWR